MRIAVAAIDGTFDSGFAAIMDVLGAANALSAGDGQLTSVTVVGAGTEVRTGNGLVLTTVPVTELESDVDLVVLPAVGFRTPEQVVAAMRDPAHAWVLDLATSAAATGTALAAACSGAFFLAEAGVLDGRRATTSWWLGPAFRQRYPSVELEDSRTLVDEDHRTTAGAAFAHIDLALWIVRQRSLDLADLVARYLLIGDRPSQAAFALPTQLARADPLMTAFERWARAHLADPPPLTHAARALGVSTRTLQRTAQTVLGKSPLDFIQDIRLDEATHLLRTTTLSADAIAGRVGYRNAGTLRELVRRRRGVTLEALRNG
ncbi:Transcriptional regulator GlxA family, contains an amidase domain and an AraC-type DNA-binding HTH domain [Lentzea fradiae]|uniref:Transcriptional regulator GlxA family, contains an amidase domain and an AraC-type DNA-binding HTH domain n=1 Tax=Lentzea fradiae TaxID=200378 RepID=A0A1G7KYZ4_9PSEU|nr:helix-turn-helix domain-containing protein [Lentzea fradiae]SDF42423.1 Transcriptional regulator GlxA family, contains an amidase domain and an AraC-type DNA-binding HTH domain [Lentzea fradiae]